MKSDDDEKCCIPTGMLPDSPVGQASYKSPTDDVDGNARNIARALVREIQMAETFADMTDAANALHRMRYRHSQIRREIMSTLSVAAMTQEEDHG